MLGYQLKTEFNLRTLSKLMLLVLLIQRRSPKKKWEAPIRSGGRLEFKLNWSIGNINNASLHWKKWRTTRAFTAFTLGYIPVLSANWPIMLRYSEWKKKENSHEVQQHAPACTAIFVVQTIFVLIFLFVRDNITAHVPTVLSGQRDV